MKVLTKDGLNEFISAVIHSGSQTYGVQNKGQDEKFAKFHYDTLKKASDLRLDYDVTVTPPKMYFTPAKETILKFTLTPEVKAQPVFETNRQILIGVHPYDMIAINQMDEVFKDKNEDLHYFKRRKNTIIIGTDPQKISSWSFWCHMDAGVVETGYDLWLTKLDNDTYLVEVATEAGGELLKKYAKAANATEEQISKRDHLRKVFHKECDSHRKLNARPGEIPLLIKDKKDHPLWEEKAKKCYSCGSCNMVCPTCYCFDVQDDIELNLKDGKRTKKWDGCQLEGFAEVGSGENFREHRIDRYKHRLFRKTLYMYERYNHLACVGCGRCSSVCLPNIADPVDIINSLKEGK